MTRIDSLFNKEYHPKKQINRTYTIITGKDDRGNFIFGETIYPRLAKVVLIKGGNYYATDEFIKKFKLKYDPLRDVYREPSPNLKLIEIDKLRHGEDFDFSPLIKDFPLTIKDKINLGMSSPTYLLSENKKYSFGVEIETSSGRIPRHETKFLNFKAEYDGSLYDDIGNKAQGREYITGVLRGDAGFLHLKKIVKTISTYCNINSTCSIHVHLGDITFNKETIVFLYKASMLLEKELFSMMPPSRKGNDYCSPMRSINFSYDSKKMTYEEWINSMFLRIYSIVAERKPSAKVNKFYNHPRGRHMGYDLNTARYWWVNFLPSLFNMKGLDNYTIEYRLHSATLNYNKIRNWILILMGIVNLAIDHKKFLLEADTLTIKKMLQLTYPTKWDFLNSYVEDRKKKFTDPKSSLIELTEYSEKNNYSNVTFSSLWD